MGTSCVSFLVAFSALVLFLPEVYAPAATSCVSGGNAIKIPPIYLTYKDLWRFLSLDVNGTTIDFPALFVFGDSWLDDGNNNILNGIPPNRTWKAITYGVSFGGKLKDRSSNGRNLADFINQLNGLPFQPPYLSLRRSDVHSTMIGANYASSGSGILPETGTIFAPIKCLNFDLQIDNFNFTVKNLRRLFPNDESFNGYLSESLILINFGNNDIFINYEMIPEMQMKFTPNAFGTFLANEHSKRLQRLYQIGARKFLVNNVNPIGCQPFSIFTHRPNKTRCAESVNTIVSYYNENLPRMLQKLESTLPGFKYVMLDMYKLFEDVFAAPSNYGIIDIDNSCCTPVGLKNPTCNEDIKPCTNPNQHVFFDAIHPSEMMHFLMMKRCLTDSSICTPTNLLELLKRKTC